ncbi:hypothetical protein MSG28_003292 [Choristoneura fumiferana]|uniref:Uncharacterized protein n=1 Tax=Choristoneura fumiferana TaxID=7141 RepID=A0ACC0KE60_CHOFU|nr:hypothetical protein MSG28_003292 [Choristoneura fumiferana]
MLKEMYKLPFYISQNKKTSQSTSRLASHRISCELTLAQDMVLIYVVNHGKLRPWLSSSSEQKLQTFQLQDAWMPNIKPGRHSVLNHLYVYDKLVASAGSELGMEIKTY